MWAKGGFDTSFSGLKTALYNHVRDHGHPRGSELADLCASLQEAIVDVLVRKTTRAARHCACRRVVVSGGVAANGRLRERMAEAADDEGLQLCIAPRNHCTDNAAMIALAGRLRFEAGIGESQTLDLAADASWELGR